MSKEPGHYTEAGTRKFQSNGPIAWSAVFRKAAGRDGREGEGIRAALAYAAEHADAFLRWAEGHPDAWARASTAPPARKAPKAPKAAGKAPKAPKAAGKAPKAPKAAGKAPKAPKAAGKAPKAPKSTSPGLPPVSSQQAELAGVK